MPATAAAVKAGGATKHVNYKCKVSYGKKKSRALVFTYFTRRLSINAPMQSINSEEDNGLSTPTEHPQNSRSYFVSSKLLLSYCYALSTDLRDRAIAQRSVDRATIDRSLRDRRKLPERRRTARSSEKRLYRPRLSPEIHDCTLLLQ